MHVTCAHQAIPHRLGYGNTDQRCVLSLNPAENVHIVQIDYGKLNGGTRRVQIGDAEELR